ncbi:MAG: blue (type 1) copper domain protein [Solirubrobacterales bacterium]|nr:blue (type 1) copper domain protein [Solirubrobacterales bacterium]
MGLRRVAFLLVCALLGAAVAVLPAVAGSETSPTVSAESNATTCGYYLNCWSPAQVELTAPGTVTFQNSSGMAHGVVWTTGPATPTCNGVPINSSAASFNGTCSFSQTGTYRFYCYVHGPYMSGTVIVSPSATTTTTTTPGTQPGGTTTTTTQPAGTASTPSIAPTGSGSQQPAAVEAGLVALARSQRGRVVRGSLQVTGAYAGGRLEVDLLAKRAALASAGVTAAAHVGRLVRTSLHSGKLSFSVALNARARGALARHDRLPLTVRFSLTPPNGSPAVTSRSVVLHA